MQERASDAELISQSISEPERFAEVFDRHYSKISFYLRRRVMAEHADELASEVFLVAFRRRADFDAGYQSAAPWLFGIALNLARSAHRSERRRLRALAQTQPSVEPDGADDAIARADAERRWPDLVRALEGLDRDQREILLLRAWTDLTYVELAEALAMPEGTVRSRLSRARRNVQRRLERPDVAYPLEVESDD